MSGIRDSITSDASRKTNFANLVLRVLQLIFAVVVVAFYAYEIKQPFTTLIVTYWKGEESLAIAVGSLSIITSIAFALIPALVSYYYVAIAFLWDFIVFFIWCAVFGWFRSQYAIRHASEAEEYKDDFVRFAQMNWVNLGNMILWLGTGSMGIFCLLADRKGLKFGRSGV